MLEGFLRLWLEMVTSLCLPSPGFLMITIPPTLMVSDFSVVVESWARTDIAAPNAKTASNNFFMFVILKNVLFKFYSNCTDQQFTVIIYRIDTGSFFNQSGGFAQETFD